MQKLGGLSNGADAMSRLATTQAAFWRAAAELVDQGDADAAERSAAAILELAALGATDALREILRPDLDDDRATWTVACFEIGSVAPAGLHEVHDPSDAVAVLVSCDERSHVASELACTGPDGLQWIALNRTKHRTTFRFPDHDNMTAPDPTTVSVAVNRWRRQVEVFGALAAGGGEEVIDLRDGTHDDLPHGAGPSEPPATNQRPAPDTVPPRQSGHSDARRVLRRTVAASKAIPSGGHRQLDTAEVAITTRTLHTAMRSAVAEVIPHLEQYLLDAVAAAVAESRLEDRRELSDIRNRISSLPTMVGSDVQARIARDAHGQRVAVPEQIARVVRESVEHSLQTTEVALEQRIGRLTAVVDTLTTRQSELRSSFATLRTVEDKVESRIDRLGGQLDELEARLALALDGLRGDQKAVHDSVRLQATNESLTLLRREQQALRDDLHRQPLLERLDQAREQADTAQIELARRIDEAVHVAVDTMSARLETALGQLTATLADADARRNARIDTVVASIDALTASQERLESRLDTDRRDTATAIDQLAAQVRRSGDAAIGAASEIRSQVDEQSAFIRHELVDEQARRLDERLDNAVARLDSRLDDEFGALRASLGTPATADDVADLRRAVERRVTDTGSDDGATRLALWEIREEQALQRQILDAVVAQAAELSERAQSPAELDRHEHLRNALDALHDDQRQLRRDLVGRLTEGLSQLRAEHETLRTTLPEPVGQALRQLRTETAHLRASIAATAGDDALELSEARQSDFRAAIGRPVTAPGDSTATDNPTDATTVDLAVEVRALREDVIRIGRTVRALRTALLG